MRSVKLGSRLGAGLAVALAVLGSGMFTSPASAATATTFSFLQHPGDVYWYNGERCFTGNHVREFTLATSGTYRVDFPTHRCGQGMAVQSVEVQVACPTTGKCWAVRAQAVTVLAEPGAWAYWVHDVPTPGTAFVNTSLYGQHFSTEIHARVW